MRVAAGWPNSPGGAVHEDVVGAGSVDRCSAGSVRAPSRKQRLAGWEVTRFAAAPLAALSARATLTAALEAYLGRRSAARVLAGSLRREVGETIRAVLLFADLRGFTALSEADRRRLSSPRLVPGSTASPVPCTPSAARC